MHNIIVKRIQDNLRSLNANDYLSSFEPKIANCFKDALYYKVLIKNEQFDINSFKFTISSDDFFDSILNDFYHNYKRIKNHHANLMVLLSQNDTHPAWIVVTAYYGCYYMALDLNRLNGSFLIYFSKDEISGIFPKINQLPRSCQDGGSFRVVRRENENDIDLSFYPASGKSHSLVWDYLHENFFTQKNTYFKRHTDSNYRLSLLTISDILSGGKQSGQKWPNPSQIRNKWNYQELSLYLDKGIGNTQSFVSILRNKNYAYRWFKNNHKLSTDDKEHVNSIGFLYHYLMDSIDKLYYNLYGNI